MNQNMNKIQLSQTESIRLGRCMNIAAELKGEGTNKDNEQLAKDIKELAAELYKAESSLELDIQSGKIAEPQLSKMKQSIAENKAKQQEQQQSTAPTSLDI